jgi:putative ABC transport system permease protein
MTLGKLVSHSLRSIFRNRIRSFLTSLGIIIGVGSVIVMVSVGQGSQEQIARQIASMGTNLIMVMPARGPDAANRLTRADVTKLRAESSFLAAISGVVRYTMKVVGGTRGSGYWQTTVMGVEPDYLRIKQWDVGSGEFFTDGDHGGQGAVRR